MGRGLVVCVPNPNLNLNLNLNLNPNLNPGRPDECRLRSLHAGNKPLYFPIPARVDRRQSQQPTRSKVANRKVQGVIVAARVTANSVDAVIETALDYDYD